MAYTSIIAERAVDLITVSGKRVPFRVEFGPITSDGQSCRCQVRFYGWGDSPPEIQGYDSLEALVLAVSLVCSILHDFVHHGGRVVWSGTDTDHDLDEFLVRPRRPAA